MECRDISIIFNIGYVSVTGTTCFKSSFRILVILYPYCLVLVGFRN